MAVLRRFQGQPSFVMACALVVDYFALERMRMLLLLVGWCLLFVLCWPLAVLMLALFPLIWLISLPLRPVGVGVEALFAFVRAVLFLPARLLGFRKPRCCC